jgi:hypothetical protein
MNIKDKKTLLIINIFCMNKVSATFNQSIGYKVHTLTISHLYLTKLQGVRISILMR